MQRIKGMIGLARRAGKVVIGTELVCLALPKGKVRLVIIASTASVGTREKLSYKCEYYKIPSLVIDIEKEELGALLGKSGSVAVVAICDESFANELVRLVSSR